MIRQTHAQQFLQDLEATLEWLSFRAQDEGRPADQLIADFKEELLALASRIRENPFIYPSYSLSNPTRRAIFYFGNYALEYQLIPLNVVERNKVSEIILTSLLATRSSHYLGPYGAEVQVDDD